MEKGSGRLGDTARRWAFVALTGMAAMLCIGVGTNVASASSAAPSAPVQDDCPYPQTDCEPPGAQLKLTISTDKQTYQVNADVKVKVCGFKEGSGDPGMVQYRGEDKIAVVEQGDGCAKPSGGTAAGLGGGEQAAAAGPSAVAQDAAFPSGTFKATPVGSGDVCAVATGYTGACTGINITGVSGAGDSPRGAARTGFELALYLAIALILVVVGANLVQWSRRRRRRIARERAATHAQVHRDRELTHH